MRHYSSNEDGTRTYAPSPEDDDGAFYCPACGDVLVSDEGQVCAECLMCQAEADPIPRCYCGALIRDGWRWCSAECELQSAQDAADDFNMDAARLED